MRKIQMYATVWTLVLAVPFTVIALVGTAYITNHLGEIATAVSALVNWRGGRWKARRAGRKLRG